MNAANTQSADLLGCCCVGGWCVDSSNWVPSIYLSRRRVNVGCPPLDLASRPLGFSPRFVREFGSWVGRLSTVPW
jgi:hypothetical protein